MRGWKLKDWKLLSPTYCPLPPKNEVKNHHAVLWANMAMRKSIVLQWSIGFWNLHQISNFQNKTFPLVLAASFNGLTLTAGRIRERLRICWQCLPWVLVGRQSKGEICNTAAPHLTLIIYNNLQSYHGWKSDCHWVKVRNCMIPSIQCFWFYFAGLRKWMKVNQCTRLISSQVVLCGLLLLQSTSQIVPNMDQNSSAEGITVITGFFTAAFWDIQVECQPRSFYMNHAKSYRLNVGSFQ